MPSTLLQCSICPRRPAFSDTSHLLTHVGSKSHLAHLHRLQVRSHQEIEAGHLLATYNLWYQQHNLGRLLSERLQQKEAKFAGRRDRAIAQGATRIKQESVSATLLPVDPALAAPVHRAPIIHANRASRRVKHQPASSTDSDYESSPIRSKRSANLRSRKTNSAVTRLPLSDAAYAAEPDSKSPATPEHAKLKGVVWPGMDLFDAATPTMKQRRNQKKDGSILKRMQKQSCLTEPTETIYSPNGSLLKERFIDGSVEVSSPLRGETPVPQASACRRRVPLADMSTNIPRAGRRRAAKTEKVVAPLKRPDTPALEAAEDNVTRSSPTTPFESPSHFSPTEDENAEFKLTVGNMANRKIPGTFTIFSDCEEDSKQERSAATTYLSTTLSNPLAGPPCKALSNPQLSFITAPWLQPAYQQASYYSDGYGTYNTDATAPKTLPQVMSGKENIPWHNDSMNSVQHVRPNPLGWPQAVATAHTSYFASSQYILDNFNGGFDGLEDPFEYNRNPLSQAVGQYDGFHETGYAEIEQRPISPDGTISDHDDQDYQQAGFAR